MADEPLSVREALASGRLEDFIRQEEARGVGPIDRAELDGAVRRIVIGSKSDDPNIGFRIARWFER